MSPVDIFCCLDHGNNTDLCLKKKKMHKGQSLTLFSAIEQIFEKSLPSHTHCMCSNTDRPYCGHFPACTVMKMRRTNTERIKGNNL